MYTKKRKFTKTFFPGIFRSRRRAEYFGKKGEVVSFIVLSILIAVGSLLLLKTSGITGAAVDGGNLGVQITVIGTCQDLATGGEYYRLSADVSSGNTCFNILDESITLDCEGHSITYATADPGYAINNSGGYNGITIKDCMIIERGSASDEYAIYFYNSHNGTIINNNITVSRQGSHGIFLSSSSNNTVSFNNVTSTTLDPFPIFLNGTSDNNLIYNPNLTISAGGTSIRDDSSGTNTLIFNNSFGQINWTKTNLTTKINLAIPDTIFLQGNLLGLIDDTNTLNLNSSAQIIMRALTYISTPYLLKSGIRCDNTNICNISYDPVSRFLYANISSFSNYTTTAEEDPPSVTITNPLNNSNISGIQIFNATVTDPSGVDTVIFMFTDDAYNQTASNVSDNWNTSVDTNGGTFSDGAHNVTVFANDTLNNVNNTETIIVNIDNTFPLFSNPLNTSLNFKRYQNFTANITITDNFIGLNSFIFSTNNSGAWVNDSAISIFGLEYNATISKNISLAKNNQICWYYWANDNVNNNDSSTTYCFTVINTIPTHSTPILNSTDPATNDTYQNLTAYNQSTSDIDEDTVKNIYNWKVNGTAIAVLNMPFEGINGTTTNNTWDYSGYGNNGTVYGGVTWNATGGYDSKGAYEFYTMGDYITVPNINLNASNNDFSVFVWSKIGQHDLHKTIVHKRGSFLIKHHNNAGGGITCRIINNTGQNNDVNAYGVWTDYNWHFIGCEFKNNDSIEVYLDGSLVNSGTFAGTHNVTENNITISDSDSSYFNGTIDEMIIFNRSLSPEQVLALYNNRTNLIVSQETSVGQNWSAEITPNDGTEDGQTLESNGVIIQAVPDTTSPTFSNPVNTSLNYRRYQNFTANITIDDETALGYYIFSTNASGSWANISAVNMGGVAQYNASEQANITLAKNNQICWYYWANDSSNNNATSTTYCFTVQNTAPAFNESLTSQDAYSDQEFNYDINCSDIDGDTITYYDNTTLFAINSTTGFINDTPTQAGVYSINISCSDGEVNTSQTFQYTIHDATIPTFSNAINTSLNFRRYQNFTANITIDDTNLSYYIFSTNSSGSWANISNISMGGVAQYNASEQANISLAKNNQICWYYWANDSSNNNASSTTYCFTVQNSPPAFNQSLTDQNAYSSIEFNYDINCSDIDGDTITYYDNTSLFAINSTTGFINDTPTQAEAGVYSINISCSDGEVNTSQTFQYTIHDSTAPTFSNAINTSLNFSRYQNFTANITINNTNLSTYIFSTNASGSWANTSARDISGNAQYNASEQANITLAKNNHICWYYWANDTSSNNATSTTYCFTVQNTPPAQNTAIPNVSLTNGDSTTINLSQYFTDLDGDEINYSIINVSIATMTINNSNKNLTITATSVGSGSTYVNASDGTSTTQGSNFTITVSAAVSPPSGSSSGGGSSRVVEVIEEEEEEEPTSVVEELVSPKPIIPEQKKISAEIISQERIFGEIEKGNEALNRIANYQTIKFRITNPTDEVRDVNVKLETKEALPNEDRLRKRFAEDGLSLEEIDDRILSIKRMEEVNARLITPKLFSLFENPFGYSNSQSYGRLFPTKILEGSEFKLQPHETKEVELKVQGGISPAPLAAELIISSNGDVIKENVILQNKCEVSAGVDNIIGENRMDVYLLTYGEESGRYDFEFNLEKEAEEIPTSRVNPTGTLMELFKVKDKKVVSNELYGPYPENYILTQQLKYNPELKGKYSVRIVTYKDGKKYSESIQQIEFK